MRKSSPEPTSSSPNIAAHDAPSVVRGFTAWHYFMAEALEKTKARGLDIHSFVRLGALPLEADVIILRLDADADLAALERYFGFLVPALRRYLVIEYKSPEDRLTRADFDTVRAYAMLCKRKYEVVEDQDVAVAMLYSRTEVDFFDGCSRNGHPFVQVQPGVRHSTQQPLGFFAVDLMAIGEQQPDHPINLLSARRGSYGAAGMPAGLGPFAVLYEEVFLREVKKMGQMHVPGSQELLNDAQRTRELVIAQSSAEDRLRGLPAEERLRGLPAEDRLRGLSPEERLRGLGPEDLARLRELLAGPKK